MVALMNYRLSPHKFLTFSTHASHNSSLSPNFRSFGFFGIKKSNFEPINVKNHRNVLFLSNSAKDNAVVTELGELVSVFHLVGLSDKEIEAGLVKNPGLGLVPIESIRSRISGLESIGLNDVGLIKLISKNPDVLTAEEVGCLIEFIRDDLGNKIERGQIERLLMTTHPSLIAGFDEKVRLLVEYGVPEENIPRILNNVNLCKAICVRSGQEIERMLTYLSRFDAIGIISKRPLILHYDLDTQLVPRIGFLMKLSGANTDGVGEALNRLPAILSYSVEHFQSHVEFFRSFAGLSDAEIFKIVLVYPNVMSVSVERKLRPRVEFLKECGLDSGEIYRFLVKSPLFLGLSFERNLSPKLAILVKIGYAYRTKEFVMAIGAASRTRCEYLQGVISLFLSYGFSCEDIVVMSNRHPQILQYNPNSLEKKMVYLIEEMDREIGELLAFPAFLGYNLDNRIKHRYELKKKVVGEDISVNKLQDISINKLLSVSSEQFSKAKKKSSVQVTNKLDDEDIMTDKMIYETTL